MGLGTGRRGMKSPPLLIAVLLACVFVLGINYWITSSRCVELQNRVMELEGRMRRAAAERGAVELKKNEYEDMLAKQKKQIDTIQTLHSGQMNNVRLLCDSEKEQLMNNITVKDNVLQTLQVQMSNAHKRLEEFKEEFKELEETQAKKLSYELAQCSNKIAEVKEQCEERLWKTGSKNLNDETEKSPPKMEIVKPTPSIQAILAQSEEEQVKPKRIITADLSLQVKEDNKQGVSPVNKEDTNKLELAVQEKKPSAAPQQPKQKVMENEDYEKEPANEVNPANNVNAAEEDDEIKAEDVADKDGKETEEVERENLINLEGLQEEVKGAKQNEQEEDAENQNDYNGDDANEAEPETDKQAQLIDNDQNLKEDKVQNALNGQAQDQETEDEEPAVK